jgi:hypothetical protein
MKGRGYLHQYLGTRLNVLRKPTKISDRRNGSRMGFEKATEANQSDRLFGRINVKMNYQSKER